MSVPIEQAKNIGPVCGQELRSIGISTLEKLQELGWEVVYEIWVEKYPDRIHTMACYALIGACVEVNCLKLDEELKRAAKKHVMILKQNSIR